jgi:hypothetical protein
MHHLWGKSQVKKPRMSAPELDLQAQFGTGVNLTFSV